MEHSRQDGVLSAVEEIFGDRAGRPVGDTVGVGGSGEAHVLAVVSPTGVDEVERLAEAAARFSVPLVGLGAGTTAPGTLSPAGHILVRFDLMAGMRLPDSDEPWVEAEPGATLLGLENNLGARGMGLAVYPTSAPRATVGGWLATGELGVGSYEYGRTSENVLSADVVLPGGERKTARGEDVRRVLEQGVGLTVSARLKTRRSGGDVPFGVFFDAPEDLTAAVADVFGAGVPLWHLAFLNPAMARARGLGEGFVLFGAYPADRATAVEAIFEAAFGARGGNLLAAADAHRAWGERFFPVSPARATPAANRVLVPLSELVGALAGTGGRPKKDDAVQGTVARSGEVLLLVLEAGEAVRGVQRR